MRNVDYIKIFKYEEGNSISVAFFIENDLIIKIGEKMSEINELAYMNGYNWEAVLNYYISKVDQDLAKHIQHDPEAGMYCAYFNLTPENEARALRLKDIIIGLIENEQKLYKLVEEHGDEIEWD